MLCNWLAFIYASGLGWQVPDPDQCIVFGEWGISKMVETERY